jgi:hypothetical protein
MPSIEEWVELSETLSSGGVFPRSDIEQSDHPPPASLKQYLDVDVIERHN